MIRLAPKSTPCRCFHTNHSTSDWSRSFTTGARNATWTCNWPRVATVSASAGSARASRSCRSAPWGVGTVSITHCPTTHRSATAKHFASTTEAAPTATRPMTARIRGSVAVPLALPRLHWTASFRCKHPSTKVT